MRIAIDVRSLMEGRHSGVEEYTTQLIKALLVLARREEIAQNISIVLFYNSWKRVSLPDFGEDVEVVAWRYPNKLFNLMQFLFRWPRWDSLVSADVFFVPNARLLPLLPDTPYVVTAHDLSFERFPEFYSWRRRVWHWLVRPRDLLRNAKHVIAVSEATRSDVISLYGVHRQRVSIVRSGVATRDSLPMHRTLRERLPGRYILYFGTQEPRKNISSIIEAYSAIADTVDHALVIAGTEGWLKSAVQRAYSRSRVKDRIHFLGFIEDHNKFSLYAGADLFVYPSFYEGFGFPPLEALLAGTPVVTSYNSSLPEIVGDYATLVDPYDVSELALVMRELLQHPPLVTEAMREELWARYSWEGSAWQTYEILRDSV